MVGNSPSGTTNIDLEAYKSFALGLQFVNRRDNTYVDLTGCTVRMVIREPNRLGGDVVLTKNATVVGASQGVCQVELQADELGVNKGSYPYAITLVTAANYSSVVLKGELKISDNADHQTDPDFTGINPSTQYLAYVENGGVVKLEVTSIDGLGRVLDDILSEANAYVQQASDDAQAAHDDAATASGAAGAASGSAGTATSAANTATSKAQQAADSATGAAGSADAANTSKLAAAKSADEAQGWAEHSHSEADRSTAAADRSQSALDITLGEILGNLITEDLSDPGTYIIGVGAFFYEDPADPGTYLMGVAP